VHKTPATNNDASDSDATPTPAPGAAVIGRRPRPMGDADALEAAHSHYSPAPGGPDDPAVRGHLKIVVSKRDPRHRTDDDDDEDFEDCGDDWKLIAHIMDRLLFTLFLLVSSLSSFAILVVRPLMKPSIHLEQN